MFFFYFFIRGEKYNFVNSYLKNINFNFKYDEISLLNSFFLSYMTYLLFNTFLFSYFF